MKIPYLSLRFLSSGIIHEFLIFFIYPMKRKHWEPLTGGQKELRGTVEWERISWDEAFRYVADELKHVIDTL